MKIAPIMDDDAGPRPDPRAPGLVRLRQTVRALFRSVVGEQALILRVDRGHKVIRGGIAVEAEEGTLVLIPAGLMLDVENHPAADEPYRATGLLVGPGVSAPRGAGSRWQTRDPRALAAFDRALDLARRPAVPVAIRDHAVAEVLLWLDTLGIRLPPVAADTVAARVRGLAAGALARDWTAAEVARTLAMSPATLRRRLAEEGTGLAEILTELRMNRALGLLQATDLPVGVIAAEVGYASASRFAVRFRARFGLPPRAIRGDERIGTVSDRPGTDAGGEGGAGCRNLKGDPT